MRSVEEWIGKSDDAKIPARVKLRIFARFDGVCQLSGRKIMAGEPWQVDHIKALWRGGEHREANLQPVLSDPHREKSSQEQSEQAKCDRIRKKHLGLWPSSKAPLRSRGFAKTREI